MSVVAELAGVSIVRGEATLLDGVDWRIDEADRWVIIGPNGAGKTTMLQILAAQMHPSSGLAEVLGEVLGSVDVFELRPRIGVASAALADRIPRSERVADVVISAAYAVMGRWRENYELADLERAVELMNQLRVGHLAYRTFGTLSEGVHANAVAQQRPAGEGRGGIHGDDGHRQRLNLRRGMAEAARELVDQ